MKFINLAEGAQRSVVIVRTHVLSWVGAWRHSFPGRELEGALAQSGQGIA